MLNQKENLFAEEYFRHVRKSTENVLIIDKSERPLARQCKTRYCENRY